MRKICFVVIVLMSPFIINAQKSKPYKVWIDQMDNSEVIKGFLYSADDHSVQISKIAKGTDSASLLIVDAKRIKQIKLRRKGKIGRGAGIGAASGVLLGGILGLADGDDEPGWFSATKEEKAVGGGILLFIPGAAIGAGIGAIKMKIVIQGNMENYSMNLDKLRACALNSNPDN